MRVPDADGGAYGRVLAIPAIAMALNQTKSNREFLAAAKELCRRAEATLERGRVLLAISWEILHRDREDREWMDAPRELGDPAGEE